MENDPRRSEGLSRRAVLQAAAAAPLLATPSLRWLPSGDERCVLVVELAGGNDGLNMLIPTDDPAYARARPRLSAVREDASAIGDGFSLHAAMRALHPLFGHGRAAFVHGVGYPSPDRSHFRSRDVWHTADPTTVRATAETTGWLGRAADRLAAAGAAVPALSVGSLEVPLLLRGRRVVVPSVDRLEDYELLVDPRDDDRQREAVRALVAAVAGEVHGEGPAAHVAAVANAAVSDAARLRVALQAYRPCAEYPDGELGRRLQLAARVVVSGFGTRLLHVQLGGFDTHARQLAAQEALLRQVAEALAAFVRDLDGHRAFSRVLVLVVSEFGRRVRENLSQGTDHGAAAPVLLLGQGLRSPLLGTAPDLEDLDDGDLRHTTDFRAVYASALSWLDVDAEAVLGGRFGPLPVFA